MFWEEYSNNILFLVPEKMEFEATMWNKIKAIRNFSGIANSLHHLSKPGVFATCRETGQERMEVSRYTAGIHRP